MKSIMQMEKEVRDTLELIRFYKQYETHPEYQRYYFENAVLCGECTGAGCKRCYKRKGIESFWEYNYNHRDEDPIMIGVTYSACVKELQNPNR